MIDYDRGSWYGIHLLFRLRGSLLPRCVPAALLGACIAGGVELAEAYYDFDLDLGDKYSMQLFGLVFGYLSIARLNISYNRYWEGATELHVLHSKWADAASQTRRPTARRHRARATTPSACGSSTAPPRTPSSCRPRRAPGAAAGWRRRASKSKRRRPTLCRLDLRWRVRPRPTTTTTTCRPKATTA